MFLVSHVNDKFCLFCNKIKKKSTFVYFREHFYQDFRENRNFNIFSPKMIFAKMSKRNFRFNPNCAHININFFPNSTLYSSTSLQPAPPPTPPFLPTFHLRCQTERDSIPEVKSGFKVVCMESTTPATH